MAHGWHNDTVSRTLNWQFTDGVTTIPAETSSLGANTKWALKASSARDSVGFVTVGELVLTNSVYAQFRAQALASGKYAYVLALVLERVSA